MTPLYGAWLAFVALERLVELWISRRHIAALGPDERARVAENDTSFALLVSVHVASIALPALETVFLHRHPPLWLAIGAFSAFAAAQVLRVWSITTLGTAWNARAIVARSARIVDGGPYAFVRHPNYTAVLIEMSAIPLGGGCWIAWIVLNVLHTPLLAARVRGEERWLAEDPIWRARMAQKPRFWPRLRRG